jgi:hypothetical protein
MTCPEFALSPSVENISFRQVYIISGVNIKKALHKRESFLRKPGVVEQ